jgi:hypothetical protein
MQTIVLDDQGHSWDARSPTLRRLLRCPLPDFDFLTYLVDNLGFVTVTKTGPHTVRLQMRPELASQTSLAAALYYIADMELDCIIISHPGDTRVHRLFRSVTQVVTYLAEQIAAGDHQGALTLVSQERPIELLADAEGPLASLLAHWVSSGHVYNSEELASTLIGPLHERFVIVDSDDRLTISDVGDGFRSYAPAWHEHARGLRLEEQPDYDYGCWVQDMYRRVRDTAMPRLDDVDVVIRRPDRNDRVRVRYRRLILPFKYGMQTRLLGASVVDEILDLEA